MYCQGEMPMERLTVVLSTYCARLMMCVQCARSWPERRPRARRRGPCVRSICPLECGVYGCVGDGLTLCVEHQDLNALPKKQEALS